LEVSPVTTLPPLTGPLSFFACRGVLIGGVIILLLAAQVAGVDRHSGFDLLLGQLHPVVEDLEELLGFLVFGQAAVKRALRERRRCS
uniref:Uncharacterized protein n=1 Tax=Paramormyrops kingsleyae TaxID=1676925 RepID=A0A3B3Q7L0_9TELE